jgi:zinc protease
LPDWELPRVERATLESGLRIGLVRRPGLGLLELRMVVSGGSSSDGDRPGIAALTSEWLKAGGSAGASSKELVEHSETLGARLSIATTLDATVLSLSTPEQHFDEALALLARVVREPRFSVSEFEKLKEREIERVASRAHGDNDWMAMMALHAELFRTDAGRHPYARFDARPADLALLEPADGQSWYAANFSPQNSLLLASGDVTMDRFAKVAEAAFGSWRGAAVASPVFATPSAERSRRIALVDKPGSRVSELRIGALGPERQSPRWPALSIVSQILGGSPNARLALDVHRAPSFAHSASASLIEVARGPVPIVIAATIPVASTGPGLATLLERARALVDEAPARRELEISTRELAGAALFGLDTNESAADLASRMSFLGLGDEWYEEYRQQLEHADPDDVHAVATDALSRVQAAVVVGDAELLVTPLSHFGQVNVLDPENDFRIERIVTQDPTAPIELPDAAR